MERRQKLIEVFWISRRILRDVLFPLAIFLLIVFLVVYIVKHVPSAYQLVNQYEVLRDLLMILLAGLAVAAGAIYYFLLRGIKESVKKDMRREFSEIRGKLKIQG